MIRRNYNMYEDFTEVPEEKVFERLDKLSDNLETIYDAYNDYVNSYNKFIHTLKDELSEMRTLIEMLRYKF